MGFCEQTIIDHHRYLFNLGQSASPHCTRHHWYAAFRQWKHVHDI